ncbi:hypothetical protein [Peptostreptococcus faecalis]|uniref:hypothetical protein n=1 Tax=Peptostreptococcus faecalis TaxID=2045015 RepID=UPI000C7B7185|nr:hypothetical protein [Peptostreptococcus faecalis]
MNLLTFKISSDTADMVLVNKRTGYTYPSSRIQDFEPNFNLDARGYLNYRFNYKEFNPIKRYNLLSEYKNKLK